jgi:hypothetical protein
MSTPMARLPDMLRLYVMTPSTFGQKRLRTPRANGTAQPTVTAAPMIARIH